MIGLTGPETASMPPRTSDPGGMPKGLGGKGYEGRGNCALGVTFMGGALAGWCGADALGVTLGAVLLASSPRVTAELWVTSPAALVAAASSTFLFFFNSFVNVEVSIPTEGISSREGTFRKTWRYDELYIRKIDRGIVCFGGQRLSTGGAICN